MSFFITAFMILVIMFCGIGIVVCMGVFADKLDDLLRGGYDNED